MMENQKPNNNKRYWIRDIVIKPRAPKWERKYLEKKETEEYLLLCRDGACHPLIRKAKKTRHFLKWAIKLLVPDFLIGHPNLWDNLKTLRKHPQFKPLRMALIAWILFSLTLGSAGIYSLMNAPFSEAATFADDTQAEFDAGTYNLTQWDAVNSWVELSTPPTSGDYTSSVKDAGGNSSWNNISWVPERPTGKELPDNAASETVYTSGNANMTGNVLLMHMNEASGTIVDTSGQGNNGTYNGALYSQTGKLNTALGFDGVDDYVNCGSGDSLEAPTITVEAWIKRNAIGARNAIVSDTKTSTSDRDHYLVFEAFSNNKLVVIFGDGTKAGTKFSVGTIADTNWHHVVVVRNDNTEKLTFAIDGNVESEVDYYQVPMGTLTTLGSDNLQIGKTGMTGYPDRFNGRIDELAIYNRALSATEIVDHYKRGVLRLKYQVRSGATSPPSGDFIGPDGTTTDYYQWGTTNSTSTPSFALTNVANNQYFQYKAYFETDDASYTPELKSVTTDSTILNQPPDTPTNSTPANGATGQDLNVSLTGSAYSDTESNPQTDTGWQVDDDADFATPVWTRTAGAAETTTTVNGSNGTFANELAGKTELDHDTTYYWRVRYSDGQWSNYSASTTFTTNLINAPTNNSPADSATLATLTPLLEASTFSDDQTGHTHAASQWLVDDNSDFSSVTYDSGETASGETSRAVPGGKLTNYSTYYWKVRYKDSSGLWSNYSTSTYFSIQISETAVEVRPVFGNVTVDQGDSVKIDVQVINFTDGSPLNSATSTINIYNPSGTKIVDGAAMTYVTGSNGIYRYAYTVPAVSGSYLYEVTATQGSKNGYGASNFEVRTLASDISSTKSTVESEETAQTTERTSQEAERTAQTTERASSTAERAAQAESRTKVEDIQTKTTDTQTRVQNVQSNMDILIGAMIVTQSTVNDASASTTAFITALTNSTDDFYNNAVLTFTSGNLDGQSRRISDYNGTTKTITLDPALTSAPANSDAFTIVAQNVRVEEQVAAHETSQAAFRSDTTSRLTSIESKIDTITTNLNTVDTNLDSVLSTVNSIRTSQENIYSEIVKARNQLELQAQKLARTLEILGAISPSLEKLLQIDNLNTENLIDVQNKVADLRAVSATTRRIVEQKTVEPIVETYMKFNSVEIHFLITNPDSNRQVVKFKAFLPEEAKPEHILDLSGLKVDYDTNAKVYYVSGDITLGPKETVTRKVEMKDIWVFAPEEIKSIRDQANGLVPTLAKTQYEAQGAILKNDIDSTLNIILLRQEEGYASPQDHIVVYRENKERMARAENNLEKLKDLVVQAGALRGVVGQVGGIQTFATWGIILAIVFGFGLLAAVIFAMWRHQTMLVAAAMGMSQGEIAAHFGEAKRRRRKISKRDETAETRSPSIWTSFIWRLPLKKILIWLVLVILIVVLGILAIKLAPGLFGLREVGFEKEETSAVAPTAPQEKSIGSQLVPETQDNVKVFFDNGEVGAQNPKLRITDTPTGWLNVRNEASLDGKTISKIYPGDEYEYTDEKGGWYKIILKDKTEGWIFGSYTEKIKN